MPKKDDDKKNKGGNPQNVTAAIAAAGQKLGGKEVKQIAQQFDYTPASIISRAEKADVKITPSAQNFVQQAIQAQSTAAETAARQSAPAGTTPEFLNRPDGTRYVTYNPITPISSSAFEDPFSSSASASANPLAGTTSLLEAESANKLALGQIQKQIAALQEAGATERVKYEVDNRIPLAQAESKGKIDLQKIVNAGYKNIANIERGTEMVRNITSMFNF
jgi:hypothetical protein